MSTETTYTCDICKKAPRNENGFRRKYQWRTEKGLLNHDCYAAVKQRIEDKRQKDAADRIEFERLFAEYVAEHAEHRIGDIVNFVAYRITAPTHEWRGNRSVRVRYEELRRYYADSGVVNAIEASFPNLYSLKRALETGDSFTILYVIGNARVPHQSIFVTHELAQQQAMKNQASYDTSVKEAESYR